MPLLRLGSCADVVLTEACGFWLSLVCSYRPCSSFLSQTGKDVTLEPSWGGEALCGENSEKRGRRQGTKGVRALFVLVVASFPSDIEVEQDGGGVSMSEQTLPQK